MCHCTKNIQGRADRLGPFFKR